MSSPKSFARICPFSPHEQARLSLFATQKPANRFNNIESSYKLKAKLGYFARHFNRQLRERTTEAVSESCKVGHCIPELHCVLSICARKIVCLHNQTRLSPNSITPGASYYFGMLWVTANFTARLKCVLFGKENKE